MAPPRKLTKEQLEHLVKSGKTSVEIGELLGVHRNTVVKSCKRYKLPMPMFPKNPNKKIDEAVLQKLIEAGNTTGKIMAVFGCTRHPICKMRKKLGLPLPKRGHARKRKYYFDFRFFETIDTEEKAYILGFVSADGFIHERSLIIKIRAKDLSLLSQIADAMHCNYPPRIVKNGLDAEIAFGNIDTVHDLSIYGVVPRKTFTLPFAKNVPSDLIPHYMRGVMDGDGTIAKKYREASFCSGSIRFMNGFKHWYMDRYGFKPYFYKKKNSNTMSFHFSRKDKRFLDDMYATSKIHLCRKRDRYLKNWPFKSSKDMV